MILFRYIIREHILPFVYSILVIVFIFMMETAVQLLRDILYKGLDLGVLVELFAVESAWMFVLAVPMAVLVSNLMTFGRMSADNEIMAIKASGRNLLTLLVPVALASAILAWGMLEFHNRVLPDANHRSAALISDISRKKPTALIEPGILIKDFAGYAIMVNGVNTKEGKLSGIKIFTDVPGQDRAVVVADSGRIELTKDERYLMLTLYSGETHSRGKSSGDGDYMIARFKEQKVFIENVDSRLRRTDREFRGDREKSATMLLKDVDGFKKQLANTMHNYHERLAQLDQKAMTLDSLVKVAKPSQGIVPDSVTTFDKWTKAVPGPRDLSTREFTGQTMNAHSTGADIKRQEERIAGFEVEIHKKYATAAACLVFLLIGAPLGIMAKRGGIGVGVSYSLFFFIVYWAMLIEGEDLGDKLIVTPFFAMWSANILMGIIGLILLFRMVRERSIISINLSFIPKFFSAVFARKKSDQPVVVIKHRSRGFADRLVRLPQFILQFLIGKMPAYLFQIFVGNLMLITIGLLMLFIVVDYVSNLNKFSGATMAQVGLYYCYYSAWFINVIFPIAVLLASMFAMTIISRTHELTAMKAAGMGIKRITYPLLVFGLLLSIGSFYLGELILPIANSKRYDLQEDMKANDTGIKRAAGSHGTAYAYRNFYYFSDKNTTYSFEELRTAPFYSRGASRVQFSGNRIAKRIDATRMDYVNGKWTFVGAAIRTFADSGKCSLAHVALLPDSILPVNPDQMVAPIKEIAELSYWEMSQQIKAARMRGEDASRYQADLDFKVALPFMNFVVMLVGLSITARVGRKGGAVAFGMGLGLVFAYWIGSQFLLALGKNGTMNPTVSAWIGNVLFLVIGFLLYQRASK